MSDPIFKPRFGWAGRPPDLEHLAKFALTVETSPYPFPTEPVERILNFPLAAKSWYRQQRGNCTGAGVGQAMSAANAALGKFSKYDFDWLYCRGCETDGVDWTDCRQDTGGFLRATLSVALKEGLVLDYGDSPGQDPHGPFSEEGIDSYRWILNDGTAIDWMRASINAGVPVLFGSPWFEFMTVPREVDGEFRIDERRLPVYGGNPGTNQGGHAYTILGWSDRRDAGFLVNTWGPQWPGQLASGEWALGTWYPAEVMLWIMSQGGFSERAVILDRPGPDVPPPPPPPPPPDPTPVECSKRKEDCRTLACCSDLVCRPRARTCKRRTER